MFGLQDANITNLSGTESSINLCKYKSVLCF